MIQNISKDKEQKIYNELDLENYKEDLKNKIANKILTEYKEQLTLNDLHALYDAVVSYFSQELDSRYKASLQLILQITMEILMEQLI